MNDVKNTATEPEESYIYIGSPDDICRYKVYFRDLDANKEVADKEIS